MDFKMNTVTLTVASLAILLMMNTAMAAFISENQILGDEYDESQTFYAGVPVLKPTEACSSFGGMCVHEDDCSESTSPKGMCAERGTNLECCYIVKTRPAPCGQYGGECSKTACPHVLVESHKVTNCASDEYCCVLV